jgi:hypothetical protein
MLSTIAEMIRDLLIFIDVIAALPLLASAEGSIQPQRVYSLRVVR